MKSFFYILILLLLIACSSDDTTDQQKIDLKKINDLGSEIIALVESSECDNKSECAYIGFGSKPCGGPWSYLVYATSIDVDLLTSKVEAYNEMQNSFNIKYGIFSDCLFVSPPADLFCEDGKCKGIYNEVQ